MARPGDCHIPPLSRVYVVEGQRVLAGGGREHHDSNAGQEARRVRRPPQPRGVWSAHCMRPAVSATLPGAETASDRSGQGPRPGNHRDGLPIRRQRGPERRQVRVSRVIAAEPHALFELLADPRTHARLDGSGMLRGEPDGPGRLTMGETFTMGMSQAWGSYRSTNLVVEYELDHRIAWQSTGRWRGRKIVGGQRWRYVLHPHPVGTWVEHAYVWGYATLPLLTVWLPGFTRRMRPAMEHTLANLAMLSEDVPELWHKHRRAAGTSRGGTSLRARINT